MLEHFEKQNCRDVFWNSMVAKRDKNDAISEWNDYGYRDFTPLIVGCSDFSRGEVIG